MPMAQSRVKQQSPAGGQEQAPHTGGQKARKQWKLQSRLNDCEKRHVRGLQKQRPQVRELWPLATPTRSNTLTWVNRTLWNLIVI